MTYDLYQLTSNKIQGRFIIANECIDAKSHIMTCFSFTFSIMDSYKKRLCATCLSLSSVSHDLRCKYCDQVYFCSMKCQLESLNRQSTINHALICPILRKLANYKCSNHEKSILKMIVFLLYQKLLDESKHSNIDVSVEEDELKEDMDDIIQDLRNLFTLKDDRDAKESVEYKENAFIDESCKIPEWSDLDQLQSHFHEWSDIDTKEWLKPLKYLLSLIQDTILLPSCTDPKTYLYHKISQIESNGFGLWKKNGNVCMGRVVFPLASFFNHSCDSNCICIQDGKMMRIFTKRKIEKGFIIYFKIHKWIKLGQELTISYIDTNAPVITRRQNLSQNYFFDCECCRCISESKGGRQKISYSKTRI